MRISIPRLILLIGPVVWAAGCQATPTPAPPPTATATVPPTVAIATATAQPTIATATPTANPPVVASLTAESGDTVIRLSWQPVPGALGYFVYRDNSPTPLNPTAITLTRFDDIGLTNGRTYTYTIAALKQDGQSGPRSAPIQVSPKSR